MAITLPCADYPEIFRFYLEESQRVVNLIEQKPALVLKTDLYNEEQGTPYPGGIMGNLKGALTTGLEYQQFRVEAAQHALPKLAQSMRKGDIRKLSYPDEIFDLVIDLSTIDHVRQLDVPMVLREYDRVLNPGGYILLIVWTDDVTHEDAGWDPNSQYFFKRDFVTKEVKKHFQILDYDKVFVFPHDTHKWLMRYVGKKA